MFGSVRYMDCFPIPDTQITTLFELIFLMQVLYAKNKFSLNIII